MLKPLYVEIPKERTKRARTEGSEEVSKSLGWQGAAGEAMPDVFNQVARRAVQRWDGKCAERRRRSLPSASRRTPYVKKRKTSGGKDARSSNEDVLSKSRIRFTLGQTSVSCRCLAWAAELGRDVTTRCGCAAQIWGSGTYACSYLLEGA